MDGNRVSSGMSPRDTATTTSDTSRAARAVPAISDITRLRVRLHRNGYRPLPITAPGHPIKNAGKAPSLPQWRQKAERATESDIMAWSSDQVGVARDTNTGLLCGELIALDIDAIDLALAKEMTRLAETWLGVTPLLRIGQAPRCLLVYRTSQRNMTKIATPEMFLSDGTKAQVEVLGEGQQFVAYGTHPVTMKPYVWDLASPLDTPVSDLPVVTRDKLLDLVDAAEKLLRAKGGLTKQERAGTGTKKKAPRGRTGGGAAAVAEAADDGQDFFRRLNREALDNIGAWAPVIFPTGRFEKGTGAFRVRSADLGRALQEDLSIHPEHGGRDFGEEISCSPIDIVMRYGAEAGVIDAADELTDKADVLTAAIWLCERLGIEPVTLGYRRERPEVAALISGFNKKHFVTIEGGATVVMTERYDHTLNRIYFTRSRFRDIAQLHANQLIKVGEKDNGTAMLMPAGKLWLSHQKRRTYLGGVVFDPSGNERDDQFNLWQGFAVTPAQGDWFLMRQHMLDVICGSDIDHCMYLHDIMARIVQRPGETGEVVIVLRGPEGVGKGVLARMLVKLFGRHGLQVSNPTHLTGKFNEHLRDLVMLFADECFYAGDKAHTGILKALATEPTLMIEPKGFPAFPVPNRLHIIMASNNDWVVPASLSSRRFFVLDVLRSTGATAPTSMRSGARWNARGALRRCCGICCTTTCRGSTTVTSRRRSAE